MPCWRAVVELHPEALAVGVDQAVGVRRRSRACGGSSPGCRGRYITMVTWCSASGRLVQKSQLFSRAAQVGARVALHGVVEVGELQRVAEEEHRRVVADEVPVALLGVELHREAADVALGVGRAALAGHGREADEQVGLLADLGEDLGLGVLRDVVGDREGAEGAGALGVHAPLRDDLAVEVGELLEEPDVLEQQRAARTGGQGVLVVRDRCAGDRGQRLLVVLRHYLLLEGCFVGRSAGGAQAPVGDLGLVDEEAVVVRGAPGTAHRRRRSRRRRSRRRSGRRGGGGCRRPAPRSGPAEPAGSIRRTRPDLGQGAEHVVDGLGRNRAELASGPRSRWCRRRRADARPAPRARRPAGGSPAARPAAGQLLPRRGSCVQPTIVSGIDQEYARRARTRASRQWWLEGQAYGVPLPRHVDLEPAAGQVLGGHRAVAAQVGQPDAHPDGLAPGGTGDLAGGAAVREDQLAAPTASARGPRPRRRPAAGADRPPSARPGAPRGPPAPGSRARPRAGRACPARSRRRGRPPPACSRA